MVPSVAWRLLGAANAEVQRLASSEPLALAAEWSIRSEALWRRMLGAPVDRLGIPSLGERRRFQERQDAARLRGGTSTARAVRPRRSPVVNWHEGGSGPPLLLLNGWGGSGLAWPSAWLRALEEHFHVIRVDQRGSGWSRGAPAPFTIADLADDVRDVLGACGVDRATVVGYSMGGMVAQELAIRHPWRVERLMLVATVPPSPAKVLASDLYPFSTSALLGMLVPGLGVDRLAKSVGWAAAVGFADEHPQLIDELVAQLIRRATPWKMVLAQGRAIAGWHGAARLTRVQAPTLVVRGGRDWLVPRENALRLSRLIPQSELVELPDVGHLIFHEAGDEVLRLLGAGAPSALASAR